MWLLDLKRFNFWMFYHPCKFIILTINYDKYNQTPKVVLLHAAHTDCDTFLVARVSCHCTGIYKPELCMHACVHLCVRVYACGWLRWIWMQKTNKETRDWYLESYPLGFELTCAAWRYNDPWSRQGACCQRRLGERSVGSLCSLL